MGDVLSQSEIDNLLNALSSGELDVDEIKENSEQTVLNSVVAPLEESINGVENMT